MHCLPSLLLHGLQRRLVGGRHLLRCVRLPPRGVLGCCGLQPVPSPLIENYDATAHVADSDAYHFAVPTVLEAVGLYG